MKLAFNNPERAIQYLTEGIPEELLANFNQWQPHSNAQPNTNPQPQQNPNQPQQPIFGAQNQNQENEGMNQLIAQYANSPAFQQIRERILQNPSYFQEFIQQLAHTNPPLAQLIAQNPQAFLQLLLGGGNAGNAVHHQPGSIQVTPEEKAAIERLQGLGFSQMHAAQAFFA